ncbi:MAG TPA: NAD(P)-binding domain-containing protein [Bryobacteraceae bacterium]|nr:NAD(P)-binding domain-containing protein [Bryobacteraceae bacterium]
MTDVLILGCGFTGQRVARRFLSRGASVTVTTRNPSRLASLAEQGARVITLDDLAASLNPGVRVLHSIPPTAEPDPLDALGTAPARIVYLSTTAVYGTATHVDATTPVDEQSDRARPRLAAERAIASGPWSSLILRPAAIYGPGRGVQESLPRGAYHAGDNYVSRIHVDDLAAHAEAALLSDLEGAYPVADEHPCTTREIAEFCASLLHLPSIPRPAPGTQTRSTSNRRVDGSAIRRALGITLLYPSYRTGIPASLKLGAQ